MLHESEGLDQARVLAELLDTALADDWNEDAPAMLLLWQASADPDDLRIAVRRLERAVEEELASLDDEWAYLAAAHSIVTRRPPAELVSPADDGPVRITVAVDHRSQSGVLRHQNGATQWFGAAVEVPIARLLCSYLWLEAAA
jgi:hypothetical protein